MAKESAIESVEVIVLKSVMFLGTSPEAYRSISGSSIVKWPTYPDPGVPSAARVRAARSE